MEKLQQYFDPQVLLEILKILIPTFPQPDYWIWIPNASGPFSPKEAYNSIVEHIDRGSNFASMDTNQLLNLKMHDRLKIMFGGMAQMPFLLELHLLLDSKLLM